jgi:YfiH family protein
MEVRRHGAPARYLTFGGLDALGVPHATTTRHCPGLGPSGAPASPFGVEALAALADSGLDLRRAAWARQVHGADVADVSTGGFAGVADVLVTRARGVPLAIFTADCLAVAVVDPECPALAVAHVGWRGTARGATRAAVDAAVAAGGRGERLYAAISPSIGPCCYEVDAPVIEELRRAYGARWEAWTRPGRADHWMLDLWGANAALLAEAGVDPGRIENPRLCTACHPDLFYSYRKANHGRLTTIAALPEG